jgi:uncharacterized membrane protein
MALTTMVRLAQERQMQIRAADAARTNTRGSGESVAPADKEEEEGQAKHTLTTALERLTGFIPTEVVAGWGAAVGLIAPTTALAAWMIFAVGVVFLVVVLLIETALRDRKSKMTTDRRRKLLMVLVAVVAFVVWVFATPGSPAAAQWGKQVTPYFGVAAIAVSAVLFKLSPLLGLAPLD